MDKFKFVKAEAYLSPGLDGKYFIFESNIFATDTIIDELRNLPAIQKVTLDNYNDISLIDLAGQPGQLSKPVTGYEPLITYVKLTK